MVGFTGWLNSTPTVVPSTLPAETTARVCEVTVKVAAELVTVLAGPVTTTRYWEALSVVRAEGTMYFQSRAPGIGEKLAPPSVDFSH